MKKNLIITISREYGSGGGEIGRKLSKALGIPCYDKELLTIAAKESGYCQEFFEKYDEKPIKSLSYFSYDQTMSSLPLGHQLFLKQFNIIQDLAQKQSCIFVGRAANYALRDKFDSIDVFIHADFETRRERAVENHGIEEKKSAKTVKKIDKERTSFYNFYTSMKWGDARDFDLCINTSKIDIDEAVEIILETVKRHYKDEIK